MKQSRNADCNPEYKTLTSDCHIIKPYQRNLSLTRPKKFPVNNYNAENGNIPTHYAFMHYKKFHIHKQLVINVLVRFPSRKTKTSPVLTSLTIISI